ncbi:MAG: hypothetical protein WBA74_13780 [Cyclobacteriaceae bacterium]
MRYIVVPVIVALFLCYGCTGKTEEQQAGQKADKEVSKTDNPALPGFNRADSDEKAIAIADKVMVAMGGRKAWNEMNTLSWNFLGSRKLTWDKPSGRVRIDNLREGPLETVIINLKDTSDVQVKMNGEVVTDSESLEKYGKFGRSAWINDSYWLVMPFKLKDSGVTLQYIREDTTATGESAHILQLTFEEVGDTPNNKYEVYVSKDRNLVAQWAFYRSKEQKEPNFNLPWDDYQDYNGLLLASDRGERDITEISVTETPSADTFTIRN